MVRSGKAPTGVDVGVEEGVAVSNRASVVFPDDSALIDNGNSNKPMDKVIKAIEYNFFIKTILLKYGYSFANPTAVWKTAVCHYSDLLPFFSLALRELAEGVLTGQPIIVVFTKIILAF